MTLFIGRGERLITSLWSAGKQNHGSKQTMRSSKMKAGIESCIKIPSVISNNTYHLCSYILTWRCLENLAVSSTIININGFHLTDH